MIIEHAGTPDVEDGEAVASGVDRRDEQVRAYFDREVLKVIATQPDDHRGALLALTREVCGLKLVESQLLGSLRAARRRADAATVQVTALRGAVEQAHHRVAELEGSTTTSSSSSSSTPSGPMVGSPSAAMVAAQLVAKTHALARAKEETLMAQQMVQTSEQKLAEAERERARLEQVALKASADAQHAIQRVREEMVGHHQVQIDALLREADDLRSRLTLETQAAQAELLQVGREGEERWVG